MARVVWLEPAPETRDRPGQLTVFKAIAPADPRVKDYERWIDTEAGRFARCLVYAAATRFGIDPAFGEPVLPIVIRKEGNHAAFGLAFQTPAGIEEHPMLAYVILDPSPASLGDTLLHECGHVAHSIAVGGHRGTPVWSAFPHTTFAVSDPVTSLAEGYAIHLETLWGHYGNQPDKRAYYHRWSPSFEQGKGRNAEFFAPIDDLMNFAQVWARYQAVRDGLPAFEGQVYSDAYPRSQMDPARDRSQLKTANAMLASEGVSASVLFWTASALSEEKGARPGNGLDQPGLMDAEMVLLEALSSLPQPTPASFRPDLLDVVEALARKDPHVGTIVISRFVDVTRGVTARPGIRARWRTLYGHAILLDLVEAKGEVGQLDTERGEIVQQAKRDTASLRAGVGPVLPVRLKGATFELKAFDETMPVEFDLNGMSRAEYGLLRGVNGEVQSRLDRERERAAFASIADFIARTRLPIDRLGLEPVDVSRPKR